MKSPIKSDEKALKNPGESLTDEIFNIKIDKALPIFMLPSFLILMAVIEWYHWLFNVKPVPILYTVISIISIIVAYFKHKKVKMLLRNVRQGRDGEKLVGQSLEQLRSNGTKIFHDIPGDSFNLDHILINNRGVFVIETKTLSKPDNGESKLQYDGKVVRQFGKELIRNPVIQVEAGSKWLAELFMKSTGKKCNPRPVVIFPGWYVETTNNWKENKTWVLNLKAFISILEKPSKNAQLLTDEDVHLLSQHLSMYIRNKLELDNL